MFIDLYFLTIDLQFCNMANFEICIILISTRLFFVYSQWYLGEEKQQITTNLDTENASRPIPAKSPTECILKCQRKLRKSYFVKDKEQCFCLKEENDSIFSNEILDGILFEEEENQKCLRSCKDVKTACDDCKSGFYLLEFDEPTKVFCDLTTDGGGWLAIANITFGDWNMKNEILNNHILNPAPISRLQEISSGRFTLNPDIATIETLHNYTKFNELRVQCFKPSHQRTLNVIISGSPLMTYLFQMTPTIGLCGHVRFLPGDNSNLSTQQCVNYRIGTAGKFEYYSLPIWIWGYRHVYLENFECDDASMDSDIGSWLFFVR
ncbi:uncharacterized protein [Clytia hemisphaerica]|uniref:Fibrinogen C-terminal domain-containing protein n=1 Tax=Clytia hemisphaerica TaxID=252671 RepID=A0A7M6DP49_9CNID